MSKNTRSRPSFDERPAFMSKIKLSLVDGRPYSDFARIGTRLDNRVRRPSAEEALTGRAALMYNFKSSPHSVRQLFDVVQPAAGAASRGQYLRSRQQPLETSEGDAGRADRSRRRSQPAGAPFMISAAIYDLTDRNQIVQPDILFTAVQGADVNARGFEIEAAGRITRELKMIAQLLLHGYHIFEISRDLRL